MQRRGRFVGDVWGPGVQSWKGTAHLHEGGADGVPLEQAVRLRRQRHGADGFRACLELPTPSGSIAVCVDVPDGALNFMVNQFRAWRAVASPREVSGVDLIGADELEYLAPVGVTLLRCCGPLAPLMVEVGYDASGKGEASGGGSNPLGALGAALGGGRGGGGGFDLGNLAKTGLNAWIPGAGNLAEGAFNAIKGAFGGDTRSEQDRALADYKRRADEEYRAQGAGSGPALVSSFGQVDPNADASVQAGATSQYDPMAVMQMDPSKIGMFLDAVNRGGLTEQIARDAGVRITPPVAPPTGITPTGLTDAANQLLGGQLDPRAIAPAFGAANALGQSLTLLQSAPELFGGLAGPIGALLRSSLRGVDALTAAQLGDTEAQRVVVAARRAAEGKVARALQLADSFLRV